LPLLRVKLEIDSAFHCKNRCSNSTGTTSINFTRYDYFPKRGYYLT
jgi:hypothetical protein